MKYTVNRLHKNEFVEKLLLIFRPDFYFSFCLLSFNQTVAL